MKKPNLPKEKILNWGLGIILALALIRFASGSAETPKTDNGLMDFSTSIPPGYVLVPIELENSLSLEGVLGDVGGYVDLYESTGRGQGRRVGEHLKLVRAPKDPRQFAVLAEQSLAPNLVRHDGPLIATMRNPLDRSRSVKPRSAKGVKIIYGEALK